MRFELRIIPKNQIETIKPLWQKLNELHGCDSVYWKDHYAGFTFEERIKRIVMLDEKNLRIEVACSPEDSILGYCFASVVDSVGEIESLFVLEKHRGSGIGKLLVGNCIRWFQTRNCTKIQVSVAEGHESVFPFYERLGFWPRKTTLELKQ